MYLHMFFPSIFMLCLCWRLSSKLISSSSSSCSFPALSHHFPISYLQGPLELLNSDRRQLTFMRLDIPVQPHSYVQWVKEQKPPHTPWSPSPQCNGSLRSWVNLYSFTTDIGVYNIKSIYDAMQRLFWKFKKIIQAYIQLVLHPMPATHIIQLIVFSQILHE